MQEAEGVYLFDGMQSKSIAEIFIRVSGAYRRWAIPDNSFVGAVLVGCLVFSFLKRFLLLFFIIIFKRMQTPRNTALYLLF